LKLAALLQQQDKAEDSLAVLRAAEEAGAPPAVLQLAWGEALIVAKEPAKAEAIFQQGFGHGCQFHFRAPWRCLRPRGPRQVG
jgi:predicted negative regulator of RcsB-dependent stress response